jgi:3'-phosphoadenosine 5'-phosphosulfate sulfotransferase (PAPS reductase)/FAD synthetase
MQPLKKNAIYIGTERKMQETEKWAEELEEKLSFTVEKFEEQNQRFMQCGKELSEAQELIEKLESSLDETNELKRML